MNKTTFLDKLRRSIGMLDDAEQKDILDEYAQHIDMKVAEGMSEAAAIEDFGDFDDLVRDILGAYHVKAPAPRACATASAATAAGGFVGGAMSGGAQATGRAVDAAKRGARRAADALAGAAGKVAAARGSAAPGSPAAAGSASATCCSAARTLARWARNLVAACFAIGFAVMALTSLFIFGLGVVLLVQGFPFAGLTIAAAGCTMALAAIAFLLARLVVRKRPAAPREAVCAEPATVCEKGARNE